MPFDVTQASYRELREIISQRSDSVVAWIGSGLSAPAGLPTWDSLRKQLITVLENTANKIVDQDDKDVILRAAEHARVETNLWNAFSLLKKNLGVPEFKAAIKKSLSVSDIATIPVAYPVLWKLGITGILSLNLDRLAIKSFSQVHPNKEISIFTGNRAKSFVHLLQSNKKWLAYLHGELEDSSSWIFTATDLRGILEDDGYKVFIQTCFSARTVIFLGISADDPAAGGHLEELTKRNIDLGGHFWITDRTDILTRNWANNAGIRLIHYTSKERDHSELQELLTDLQSYVPKDEIPNPVTPTLIVNTSTPPNLDELLRQTDSTVIRQLLNEHAAFILSETNVKTIAQYNSFCTAYAAAIYRAWYISESLPNNSILQYTITDKIAEGAFGTVWRGHDKDGSQVAIKVLHERVRGNHEMLQCFRRGVKSMSILSASGINGIVKYHNASEIPASVVMDFIEGTNLLDAVKTSSINDWSKILRIATDITSVIRHSHRLPQRVLHRDIRPSNIMLENYWGSNSNWEDMRLKILDFDLSWHLEAFDVSISQPGTANGYLAPEQVERNSGDSTKNATVDSFGIGMTLYFLRSGKDPRFGEHRYADWKNTLHLLARINKCSNWHSLPNRYSRLIFLATQDRQHNRLDVADIENELANLSRANSHPEQIHSAELIAEELACRAFHCEYAWDDARCTATYNLQSIRIEIIGSETNQSITIQYRWLKDGLEHHQNVKKWLPSAQGKIDSAFKKAGWKSSTTVNTGTLTGSVTNNVMLVKQDLGKSARAIMETLEALKFE